MVVDGREQWMFQLDLGNQIGRPLQLAIHVVQNCRALEGKSRTTGTRQTKDIYIISMVISFACLVPLRLLLSSMAVLYHVNGYLQRTTIPNATCKRTQQLPKMLRLFARV